MQVIGQDLVRRVGEKTVGKEELRCQCDHWLMVCVHVNILYVREIDRVDVVTRYCLLL